MDRNEAVLAERERIARLAENCHATYELAWKHVPFADLIRSGATAPPWFQNHPSATETEAK